MGQQVGKKTKGDHVELSDPLIDCYVRSEFKAMDAITDKDGTLLRQEVLNLLIMLGYSKASKKLKQFHIKSEEHIELEDYVTAFKADKKLVEKTMKFRQLFKMFDSNSDGTASKDEVTAGLAKLDIIMEDNAIDKMDANADGKITYQEFLAVQFKIAIDKPGIKKGKKSKKEKKSKKDKKKKDKDSDSESGSQKSKDEKDDDDKSKKESAKSD